MEPRPMEDPPPPWLTSGQAAKMCAVTPATILNWIRVGRLEARRTPGGHYRIRQDALQPFHGRGRSPTLGLGRERRSRPLRCWEYLSDQGVLREACRACIVYKVRASWCFNIASLGLDSDHSRRACPTACDDCAYYRRAMGEPTRVLVVTPDPVLHATLRGQASPSLSIHLARNAYEAAAAVESFLPAFAVVDVEAVGPREGGLLECLDQDPRLPWLKTVIAVPPGRAGRNIMACAGPLVVGRIDKPFDLSHILAVIESFPVEPAHDGESSFLDTQPKGGHP